MKKLSKKQRAREIEKAIRLAYSSLESHLPYTHKKHVDGSMKFHRECIREYSEIISILSKLY
jgi:hypothetical protein